MNNLGTISEEDNSKSIPELKEEINDLIVSILDTEGQSKVKSRIKQLQIVIASKRRMSKEDSF